jgi:hypothetical protein
MDRGMEAVGRTPLAGDRGGPAQVEVSDFGRKWEIVERSLGSVQEVMDVLVGGVSVMELG